MISFQNFDQWQAVAGFAMFAFFGLLYPLVGDKSVFFKVVFLIAIAIAIAIPFGVSISQDAQEKLTNRTGKMVHCMTFILLFYCYVYKEILQTHHRYFFWFCYALGCYSLFELFCVDVLLSSRYQFVKSLFPWLNSNFVIIDFNFTAFINYFIKFVFLNLFLHSSFQNIILKKAFQYLMWVLIVFESIQVFVFKSYQGYDSVSSTVKNIFILGGFGLLLYRVYTQKNGSLSLQKNSYFWICLGLILPALAELFLEFVFTKLYQTDLISFYKLYLVRNASQMVGFTLLIVGVWQAKYLKYLPKSF